MQFEIDANIKRYATKRSLIKKMLGYCPCCEQWFKWPVTTERRHTQYCEESNNYLTACPDCQYEDDAYFDELWKDYYASRL